MHHAKSDFTLYLLITYFAKLSCRLKVTGINTGQHRFFIFSKRVLPFDKRVVWSLCGTHHLINRRFDLCIARHFFS